jgi:flagellar biosynthesis/type III secretory pathway protein FliH
MHNSTENTLITMVEDIVKADTGLEKALTNRLLNFIDGLVTMNYQNAHDVGYEEGRNVGYEEGYSYGSGIWMIEQ